MSQYLIDIGESLANVLERAAAAQPEVFAGYVANLDFWVSEIEHVRKVEEGFGSRLKAMRDAGKRYLNEIGTERHNYDDAGVPLQEIRANTSPSERRKIVTRCRKALERILNRTLKLELIEPELHDSVLKQMAT